VFGEKTTVGTVFIASGEPDHPPWMAYPTGSMGYGGRDEDGPYGGVYPTRKNMTLTLLLTQALQERPFE
jgi:hypothetical protein